MVVDWKIWKMGCKNPLRLAGLKNKDVIHSVNGIELTNSANAFRAWRKTRNQKKRQSSGIQKGKAANPDLQGQLMG